VKRCPRRSIGVTAGPVSQDVRLFAPGGVETTDRQIIHGIDGPDRQPTHGAVCTGYSDPDHEEAAKHLRPAQRCVKAGQEMG